MAHVLTIQLESLCRTSTGTTHILITSDLVLAVAQLTFAFYSSKELASGYLTLLNFTITLCWMSFFTKFAFLSVLAIPGIAIDRNCTNTTITQFVMKQLFPSFF